VDEAKLGGEVRKNLLKQALVMYHANQRQGTVRRPWRAAKSPARRGKIFRQKGTGNARMGTVSASPSARAAVTPSRSGPRIGGRRFRRRLGGWRATARS
jgi:ribosomal protein L4